MKKIVTLTMVLVLAMAAAVWAGEYFTPAEEDRIRQTAVKLLPGAKVDFNYTSVGSVGIYIGPLLKDGKYLFFHIKPSSEIFVYRVPDEYSPAVKEILKTIFKIIDDRPAADPRALGRNLLEQRGIK